MSAESALAPAPASEQKVEKVEDVPVPKEGEAEVGDKRKADQAVDAPENDEKKQKVDEVVDNGKGKGKSTETPAEEEEEDEDDSEDEDEPVILTGRRRTRAKVDYSDPAVWKKAGVDPDADDDEDEDDGDAKPESTDDEDVGDESGIVAGDDDDEDEDDEE